jgi:tetratricopeptide (TPR) repeat protein
VYELDLARIYYNLGLLYADTQRYEEAEKAFSKALEIFERLDAKNGGIYEKIIELIIQLLSICKQESRTETRRSVGDRFMRLLKLGKYKKKK